MAELLEQFKTVFVVFLFLIALLIAISLISSSYNKILDKQLRIKELKKILNDDPEKIKPVWDLARIPLESYFNRNISQVSVIFWLSVIVMIVGLVTIIAGVWVFMGKFENDSLPVDNTAVIITAISGVLTEFIGATFLLIYKSTMKQAITYTKTLERINSVSMAMQILDTLPDNPDKKNLKHETKSIIVKMLMQDAYNKIDVVETDKIGQN